MKLIVYLIICFSAFLLIYVATVFLIRLFTGCTYEEASNKLQNFISSRPTISIENDIGLGNEIAENIKNIIGDERYERMMRLSKTAISYPLLFSGKVSRLPIIGISIDYQDDFERRVLQETLINIVKKYLVVYGYCPYVRPEWKTREDLMIPVLQLQYATNSEERGVLDFLLSQDRAKLSKANLSVKDDEDKDLYV